MRFYENKPDKGAVYNRKSFAWFPTKVGSITIWLEYYWECMYWDTYDKKYKSPWGCPEFRKLLEEHEGD